MSLKKNYLPIVLGGIFVVGCTMVYLKHSYDKQNVKVTMINQPTNLETTVVESSPEIIQEVLHNSIVSNNSSKNNVVQEETVKHEQNSVFQNTKDNHSNEILKKEQEEKDRLLQESKKEKADKEALLAASIKLQEEVRKRSIEAEKLKAEAEKLKKEKEDLAKSQNVSTNNSKICLSYGPMSIDLKNKFRNVLSSNKIANNLFQDKQLPQYEIYWNLGKNKLDALEKFEKQKKEGALRDDKYKLTQDDKNNWIVPATTIAGNSDMAETLAKQLNSSSSKFGGNWEIREKTGGHYIIFPNVNLISEQLLITIDKELRVNKAFC